MAIRRIPRRPAPQMDELLARFELINAERSLLGLPRVDPFDGLDFSTPAVDAFDGASFGSLAPSRPVRNPLRAPGPIIGSGGASADELRRQDDLVADQDEIIGGRSSAFPGFKTQSQRQGLAAREKRRRRRERGIAQDRQERARQGLGFLDGIVFDDDAVGLPSGRATPSVLRLSQPSRLPQRVSPDDATPANDVPAPNLPAAPSGAPPTADARPQVDQRQAGTAVDRILNAAGRQASRAFAAGGALGLSPESVRFFRQLGLLSDPSRAFVPPLSLITEPTLRAAGVLGDVAQRGTGAIVEGTLGGVNQLARELGTSRTTANQLEREFRLLSLVGGASAGLNPAAVSGAAGRAPALARNTATAGRRSAANSGVATRARMFQQEVREAERRQERRVGRQAVRDLGRPRIPQTSTVGEFRRVIEGVLDTGKDAVGKLFREDFGPIAIRLGDRRSGLLGIISKRKRKDQPAIDGDHLAREILPEVLAKGRLRQLRNPSSIARQPGMRRAVIRFKNAEAVLRLDRDGDKETWVLTAFRVVPAALIRNVKRPFKFKLLDGGEIE